MTQDEGHSIQLDLANQDFVIHTINQIVVLGYIL